MPVQRELRSLSCVRDYHKIYAFDDYGVEKEMEREKKTTSLLENDSLGAGQKLLLGTLKIKTIVSNKLKQQIFTAPKPLSKKK